MTDKITIRRAKHDQKNPYVMIKTSIFLDPNLTPRDKGVFGFLLCNKDTWEFYPKQIAKSLRIGKEQIYSAINSIVKAGYGKRVIIKDCQGRFLQSFYEFSENPVYKDCEPEPGFPDTDFPDTGFPVPGNQDTNNNMVKPGISSKEEYNTPPNPQMGEAAIAASDCVSFSSDAFEISDLEDLKMQEICEKNEKEIDALIQLHNPDQKALTIYQKGQLLKKFMSVLGDELIKKTFKTKSLHNMYYENLNPKCVKTPESNDLNKRPIKSHSGKENSTEPKKSGKSSHSQQTNAIENSDELIKYGEIVKMTKKDYDSFVEKHGKTVTDDLIEQMNDYMKSEGKTKKCYAATFRNWIRNRKTSSNTRYSNAQNVDRSTKNVDGTPVHNPFKGIF